MPEHPLQDLTYAELRDDDVIVAKDGAHWHVSNVSHADTAAPAVDFWLGDPRTKVRAHPMTKPAGDAVTVFRTPTHGDAVKSLEAGSALPDPSLPPLSTGTAGTGTTTTTTSPASGTPSGTTATASRGLPGVASPEEDARRAALLAERLGHEAGVAAVLTSLPGSSIDVDLTAKEVDDAAAATDDEPVVVALFETMTDLEQRSHMFVLHGTFVEDVEDRIERSKLHAAAHVAKAQNKLKGRHTPHVHTPAEVTA